MSEVRPRVSDWPGCAVVDQRRVLLGFVPQSALTSGAGRIEEVMEAAPDTVRPSASPKETLEYMGDADHALVTTSDGELVGLARRRDAEQCVREGRAATVGAASACASTER